jgi:hypothetical protein
MVSASVRRQQVDYARERGISCRRACTLLHVARSALKYQSSKAAADAPIANGCARSPRSTQGTAIDLSGSSSSVKAIK